MIRPLAVAHALAAAPALADDVCFPRAEVVQSLLNNYDEQPAAAGLAESGHVYEVLVSADGETWSLLITNPDGVTCMVAAGREWMALTRQVEGEGS